MSIALATPPSVADLFKAGMRNLGGAVSVVTVGEGDDRSGLTATSVVSLSLDPPTILVSVNKGSSTWPLLARYGRFGVNVLAAERYQGADWTVLETGAPILADALVGVDCELEELSLLAASHPLDDPAQLRHHTLLHDDSPDEDASCPDWRMWLRAAGVCDVNAAGGLRFNQSSLVLEAAAAGQGVALAKARLAEADLRSGRLVRPFGGAQHVQFAYYFVSAPSKAADARVEAFRAWLASECEGG